jgi:hypothetical protein
VGVNISAVPSKASNTMVVARVASTTQLKIDAVSQALKAAYGAESDHDVEGRSTASGVNEQPYGHAETRRGALNRLAALRAAEKAKARETSANGDEKAASPLFLVAIENGLIRMSDKAETVAADAPDNEGVGWFEADSIARARSIAPRLLHLCVTRPCGVLDVPKKRDGSRDSGLKARDPHAPAPSSAPSATADCRRRTPPSGSTSRGSRSSTRRRARSRRR